ncbi:MFS transporter [Bacillus infantis]|uniref:CynX/NimT family MFS transporter n=1 Tax=Bacillus infantis TaxID=324767 RepID=UPI000B9B2564|nr:MFS transporter [Bacillus infantis]MCK6206546.1 MFS transporter [Bacillus infantis]OXT17908.1 MFS transporter [Bacillus sp. OG2]
MDKLNPRAKMDPAKQYLFIAGIILVAFNLRPAITSLGPLVGIIQDDVGLAHWSAGLLMSLPLLVFAFMSPLVPKIALRLTNERTLLIGLLSLFTGIAVRSIPMAFFLFAGTFLAGLGIAIGNVLLPAVVKDKFPNKFGLMTSVYSTSMGLIASLASGVSVPLAVDANLGWQGAQAVWAIPVIAAFTVWLFVFRSHQSNPGTVMPNPGTASGQMWKTPLAWQLALFMGFQSSLFYITISWLPEILQSHGISITTAGWLLSFTQLVGLPASFFIPVLAGRYQSQVWIAFALSLCAVAGYCGLLIGSTYPLLIISIILIGVALGGSFPLALSYIGLRARNGRQAAELSGMAQSTGYILASIGPLFIGYLFDLTHSWTMPLITLIGISAIVMVFGMLSGRNRFV